MTGQLNRILLSTYFKEFLLVFLVVIFSSFFSYHLYGMHDTTLITSINDVYFQSDLARNYGNMTDRKSLGHYRVKVHPLNSIQTFLPTFVLQKFGIASFEAVKIVTTLIAAMWGLSLYVLMRLIGLARVSSLLFTALGFSSASAFFWLSVPESYGLGSISIMIALSFAALADKKIFSDWGYIVVSAITLSTTVTNWMAGIFATLASKPFKQTINITLVSLSLVTIFWGLQKRLFPEAVFFIGDREEASYLFFPDMERIVSVVNTFIFHTFISPKINILGDNGDGWSMISFQPSYPSTENILNIAGDAIWLSIIAIGFWALFAIKQHLALRLTLGLTILGQMLLHIVYGEETFLYSLHFLPLLLVLVALGTLTNLRKIVILLIILLIPMAATNNLMKFQSVNAIAVSPETVTPKNSK